MTDPLTPDPSIPAELLATLDRAPFVTAQAGDTIILFMDHAWGPEEIDSLGTYLNAWAPDIRWRALHQPGFSGIIHIPLVEPAE